MIWWVNSVWKVGGVEVVQYEVAGKAFEIHKRDSMGETPNHGMHWSGGKGLGRENAQQDHRFESLPNTREDDTTDATGESLHSGGDRGG